MIEWRVPKPKGDLEYGEKFSKNVDFSLWGNCATTQTHIFWHFQVRSKSWISHIVQHVTNQRGARLKIDVCCLDLFLWRHVHNKSVISKTNQSLCLFLFSINAPSKKIVRRCKNCNRHGAPPPRASCCLLRNALLRPLTDLIYFDFWGEIPTLMRFHENLNWFES